MIKRHIASKFLKYSKEYPIIALVGPRQSGKTTLCKFLFPKYKYISLENMDYRHRAISDPRGFLNDIGPYVILDEAQRVPELFSYLQEIVDNDPKPAQYILTGSSQFLLIEQITQSLAGRIITFKLFPFTYTELFNYPEDQTFEDIFQTPHLKRKEIKSDEFYELLWKGFYPRIYDKKLDSYKWYENYILTYVERDIRSLLNIRNIKTFENFLLLLASQSANLINYSNIANSLGVSLPTIKEWISILEASGMIYILPSYFKNFSKRIVKTPKIYFMDTGVLCYLLSIRNISQLKTHPLFGGIFETFIISECIKRFCNFAEKPPLYFFRDQSGNEIDLIIYTKDNGFPIEIKSSQTYNKDFEKSIQYWFNLKNNLSRKGTVIYRGKDMININANISTIPWYNI
jgi:hypothetical protein